MDSIDFLELRDVLQIHIAQIQNHGGADEIRDRVLLESAIEQARASFGGSYLHQFPYEMAAAFLFHIVMNHPFGRGGSFSMSDLRAPEADTGVGMGISGHRRELCGVQTC